MRKASLLCIFLGLLAGIRCGHKPSVSPESGDGVYYEIAWVDPQVIVADSLYTLIRADRLDSFVVDKPVLSRGPSIMFDVTTAGCSVAINLFEATGSFVRPLFVQELDLGTYQLTLHLGLFDYQTLPPGKYSLRADICGQAAASSFWRK